MDLANGLPVALGDTAGEAPTYEREVERQIAEVKERSPRDSLTQFLLNSQRLGGQVTSLFYSRYTTSE